MEPQETLSLIHARKSYLRLGWSLVVLEVGAQAGAFLIALLGAVLAAAGNDVSGTWWYFLLSNFLPIYLFGMPLALLVLRGTPKERPDNNARTLIRKLDRDELLQELVRYYLDV